MQTKAEAEHLMEQQHYGGDYVSPQDAGLADPDAHVYRCDRCGEPLTEDDADDSLCEACLKELTQLDRLETE